MIIELEGSFSIAATELKAFFYKRKGYYVGERFVKPKRIKRFRQVPLKTPFINLNNVQLKVHERMLLGGMYVDENGLKWICTTILSSEAFVVSNRVSILKPVELYLKGKFTAPKLLQNVALGFFELKNK